MTFARLIGVMCVCVLAISAARTEAATVYLDRTSWEAAVGGTFTTDPFDNPINDSFIGYSLSFSLDLGIQSTELGATPGRTRVIDGYYDAVVRNADFSEGALEIRWDFPSPIIAFGGDFSILNLNGLQVAGNFDGVGDEAISIANSIIGDSGFFGIVGVAPYSSILFNSGNTGESFRIDNFSFGGDVPEVPLPAALPLFGTGLAVMGFIGWRRKRRMAEAA